MAYTLTQARKLLTAAELPVFEASRAQPIKELTAAQLRGKVSRARTLRDKYRDLYRRQTVATRAAPARQRSAVGADNERTQHKAELFAQVLARFEERQQYLESKTAAAPAKKAVKPTKAVTGAKAGKSAKTGAGAKTAKAVPLKAAVAKALARKPAAAKTAPTRSAKAPAKHGTAAAPATAPVDVAPRAKRTNPLRERPDNITIQAHAKSQGRRTQARRDGR